MLRFVRPTLSGRVFNHDEFAWPRHPVCAGMNIAMFIIMASLWQKQAGLATEQHIYFAVTCWLYLASTLYHTLPQNNAEGVRVNSWVRLIDQVAICLFLGGIALVFVGHHQTAKQAIYCLVAGLVIFKWLDYRGGFGFRCRQMVSLSFLITGVIALAISVTVDQSQATGSPLFWLAISLFVWKLYIYNFQKGRLSGWWRTAESSHAILATAVLTLTSVVVAV